MDTLLTPKEAAAKLQISPSTLRTWRKLGKGPPVVKLSRRTYRYSEVGINDYIEKNNVEVTNGRKL